MNWKLKIYPVGVTGPQIEGSVITNMSYSFGNFLFFRCILLQNHGTPNNLLPKHANLALRTKILLSNRTQSHMRDEKLQLCSKFHAALVL